VLPIVLVAVAAVSVKLSTVQSISATIAGCGGAFLLSQLARDAGKKGEKALFERWGGMPSVAILRHRDSRLDTITKARYHKNLTKLVQGVKAPTAAEEEANPSSSDQTYTAWSTYLRVATRDTKKYPLVFKELVNYGYRRNLWGLRRMGTITSACASGIGGLWLYLQYTRTGSISQELLGACMVSLLFLSLWAFRFSSDWVRIPADAYAERLVEAIDTIDAKPSKANKAAAR
jgi:hypothetical protein